MKFLFCVEMFNVLFYKIYCFISSHLRCQFLNFTSSATVGQMCGTLNNSYTPLLPFFIFLRYLFFNYSCWSYVGFSHHRQQISIGPECQGVRIIMRTFQRYSVICIVEIRHVCIQFKVLYESMFKCITTFYTMYMFEKY